MEPSANEKAARRLTKNTFAQVARFAAMSISKFLIVVFIARIRGVEEVGEFSFVMTYTTALSFLNNFGMVLLLTREVARERERVHEYFGTAFVLSLGLGFLSVPVMGGVAALLGFSNDLVLAIVLVAIAMWIDNLGNLFNASFSGYERMELGAAAIVFQELAFLAIGAALLWLKFSFQWIFIVYIISRFVGLVAGAVIYWKLWGRPRLNFDWQLLKSLGRKSLPFAINAAFSPIFVRVDVLMLTYYKGIVAVGYYEAASTLFYRLNVLARMFNLALMPLVANQYPTIGREVVKYVRSAVKYQALLGMPITVICLVLGAPIVHLIYGAEFSPAITAFQILSTITFLRFLGNTLGLSLTSLGREDRRAVATFAMAIFNVVANLFVLPRYGFIGAAVTSVLTEIGYAILLNFFLRAYLPNPVQVKTVLKPFLAALFMAIPLLLMYTLPIYLSIPVSLVVYLAATLLFKVLTKNEMELLFKIGRVDRLIPSSLRRKLLATAAIPRAQSLPRQNMPGDK